MIPRVCYPDVVPSDILIRTRERSTHVNGNVSDFELDVINRLVTYHDPTMAFEIGTFDGRTTLNVAAHVASSARVFTLDLPPGAVDDTALRIDEGDRLFINKPSSGARFGGTDLARKITQLYGDSATFDFSPYRGKIDFLFVDGSHSYDYVLKDSETALSIVRPGGVVLWHDYVPAGPTPWPGLTRAFHELYDNDRRFGGMKHIAGTSILMMQVPGSSDGRDPKPPLLQGAFHDSSQPECLLASLSIELDRPTVPAGQPLLFRARAANTGRATWLPSTAPIGPVRLGSRLLDAAGACVDVSYSRHHVPGTEPIVQGQSIAFEGEVPCPPVGKYFLEFDFVAEGVVWFTRNGATPVRIPIEVW